MAKTDQTDADQAPEQTAQEQVVAEQVGAGDGTAETNTEKTVPDEPEALGDAQSEDAPSAAEGLLAQFKAMLDSELAPIRARLDQLEPKTEEAHGRLRQIEQKIRGFL